MNDDDFRKLLYKFAKAQSDAIELLGEIYGELDRRGADTSNLNAVKSTINPYLWANDVENLISKGENHAK